MGINSKIEWTDHTWNPWYGCPDDGKRSQACENCYARAWARRSGIVDFDNEIKRAKQRTFEQPITNKYQAGDKVFVCSLSDFFHDDVPADCMRDAWSLMAHRQDVTFIILTKRPELINEQDNWPWDDPLPNVWLGVTVENQEQADRRVHELLKIPAALRFVSVEPMLGPISLERCRFWLTEPGPKLDWVICGGETGPGKRNPKIKWVWDLAHECEVFGVPYFAKKFPFSCNPPASWMRREFPEVIANAT